MNIDHRDIEKGKLLKLLSKFYPNSISYLSELNEYRMYSEMWSNRKSKESFKRMEPGHQGYLKTLALGELKKKRKIDKVRFDYFVVADSVNYVLKDDDGPHARIQMGGIRNNSIFNEIINEYEHLTEIQSSYPSSVFHSDECLPKKLDINLQDLGLQQDKNSRKHYFEIPTNSKDILNGSQKRMLFQVLGEDGFSEKMQLLDKVDRKYIKCLFDNPEDIVKSDDPGNNISRLCIAWPFGETLVIDFAGTFKEYGEACSLGVLIENKIEERIVNIPSPKIHGDSDGCQIDTLA